MTKIYFKLVNNKLIPAPESIKNLIGNPSDKQYLFFGYKPLFGSLDNPNGTNFVTYTEKENQIIVSVEIKKE